VLSPTGSKVYQGGFGYFPQVAMFGTNFVSESARACQYNFNTPGHYSNTRMRLRVSVAAPRDHLSNGSPMTGNFAPAKVSMVSAEASVEASVMPEISA
jgi:hypothetical protein